VCRKQAERRWHTEALDIEETPSDVFTHLDLLKRAYHDDNRSIILRADVIEAAKILAELGIKIDCLITSPPFYGQRDYEVEGQIGLEDDPQDYINKLVAAFNAFLPVLSAIYP
jgi:site-specific DNA-methyltransferase (cytosine-N4-specific)